MKRKIEVVRDKRPFYQNGDPLVGRRAIMVDGKQWGEARMECHGRNGASWEFYQEGERGAIKPRKKNKNDYVCAFEVHSHSRRDQRDAVGFDQRMLDMATMLVKGRYLRDPAAVARANKEAQERHKAKLARQKLQEAERFRDRAQKCLDAVRIALLAESSAEQETLIQKIVEAMRWAQTR